ncbi:MAG TPA: hypothetical protein VI895_10855 [Bdellovibrionota bacterium]|nr:hypothetical protein [Bdellovibrionota bacterium]
MKRAIQKRLEAALKTIDSPSERDRVEAWGFLMAWKDHFPKTFPSRAPFIPPKNLDAGRLIKQRRIAIAWLAKQVP